MDKDGLKVDYDTNAGAYYVSGDIVLGPNETTLRKVEMKDIWVFSPEEINLMKDQSSRLLPVLSKTQFEAQGVILKNQIDTTIAGVIKKQDASYSSPQDHIVAYRENKIAVEQVKSSLSKMEDLVVSTGANKGLLGDVGGIQTYSTWGIIIAIFFGFALLAAVIFAMWRHQAMFAAAALGMNNQQALERFRGTSGMGGVVNIVSPPRLLLRLKQHGKRLECGLSV